MDRNEFTLLYGEEEGEIRDFFSPGRVNLIGEHTDYNGGYVFPCALSLGTYAYVRKRNDRLFRFYSGSFTDVGIIDVHMDDLTYDEKHLWSNYLKGVIKSFVDDGCNISHGLDIYIWSTIPKASGLSSSASIEVLMAYILKEIYEINILNIEIAKLCKDVENNYIGVNCGILDQFAVSMGRRDYAVLLDCNTLVYEYVPFQLQDISMVLVHTNKERRLLDSKYNERRAECDNALLTLKRHIDITALGQINIDTFNMYSSYIENDIERKRAKHAVTENQRTIDAKKALVEGKLRDFGALMKESHQSLRYDYEVTGRELDTLAELAWKFDGCIGARMTGAGFGGCTVNLIKNDNVDAFIEYITEEYMKETGYRCRVYISEVGGGPTELSKGGIA